MWRVGPKGGAGGGRRSLRRRRAGAGARGRGRDAERRGLVWAGAGPAAGAVAWAAVETLGSLTTSEEEDRPDDDSRALPSNLY